MMADPNETQEYTPVETAAMRVQMTMRRMCTVTEILAKLTPEDRFTVASILPMLTEQQLRTVSWLVNPVAT